MRRLMLFIETVARRCVLVFLFLGMLSATDVRPQHVLRLMEWNVENLFDTVHAEGVDDEEFLPESERRWTSHRYWQKLTDVAKVVAAVAEEGGVPDLIGLCEVENDSVMTMLTRRSLLRFLNYDYVMSSCEDRRGINVALLYQPVHFRLLESRGIRVPSREQGLRPTRDILYVKGLTPAASGIDTLHVFVVHLPSRAGGREGDRNRSLAAATLWRAVDSLQGKKVVVMGDFNASRRDAVFRRVPLRLTDDAAYSGTYCFRGYWQWLDHILVSSSLSTKGLARPVRLPWLLEPNKTYGGDMPRRTFRGPTYHGGVSDHLPLLLDLLN